MRTITYDITLHNQSVFTGSTDAGVSHIYIPECFTFEQMSYNYFKNASMFNINLEPFSTIAEARTLEACIDTREILEYYKLVSLTENRSFTNRIHVQYEDMITIFMFLVGHGIEGFSYTENTNMFGNIENIKEVTESVTLVGEGGIISKLGVGFLI
jgi:hypothetical protein